MADKLRKKLDRLGYDQLQKLEAYHRTANGTGDMVVQSVANLADRIRIWHDAVQNVELSSFVLGPCAVFNQLPTTMLDRHVAELIKQQRNLTTLLDMLGAQQEGMLAARTQAQELVEQAAKVGQADSRSATDPVSCKDVADLVGGLAAWVGKDGMHRVAIAAAMQEQVQAMLMLVGSADETATGSARMAAVLRTLAEAWAQLDLLARASASTTRQTVHPGPQLADPDSVPAEPVPDKLAVLAWKLTARTLEQWLEPSTAGPGAEAQGPE